MLAIFFPCDYLGKKILSVTSFIQEGRYGFKLFYGILKRFSTNKLQQHYPFFCQEKLGQLDPANLSPVEVTIIALCHLFKKNTWESAKTVSALTRHAGDDLSAVTPPGHHVNSAPITRPPRAGGRFCAQWGGERDERCPAPSGIKTRLGFAYGYRSGGKARQAKNK